ncbi:hypothetical protein EDB84DRAFT_1441427 [Lactarius hengduanensis]|nr:hypothetical protein EDB84DRAFT_1441427 [Lactarius hengduanensis]
MGATPLCVKEYARSDFQKTPPGVVTSTATMVTNDGLPINFDDHGQDHARDHDYNHDYGVVIDHWQSRPSYVRHYSMWYTVRVRSPIAFVTCNWSYGHHVVDVNIQKPSRAVHSATVVGAALRASLSLGSIVLHCKHRYSGGELVAEFVVGLGAARFPGRVQSLIARLALLHEDSRYSESRTGRTLMTFASTGINDSEAAILGQGRRGIVATTGGNAEGDRADRALASYYLDHSVDLG